MSKRAANDELLSKVLSSHDPTMQELNFLNTVFGFLSRKTKLLQQPNVSNQINNIVNKHIEKAKQKKKNKKKSKSKDKTVLNDTSDAKEKEIIDTSQSVSETIAVGTETQTQTQTETPTNQDTQNPPVTQVDNQTDDVDENQGEKLVGNGGRTDKYIWTQTLSEVEMKVDIPGDKTGKDCIVDIGDKHLKLSLKGSNDFILNGELHDKVFSDDCSWTLDQEYGKETKTLTIFLTKSKGMNWWNRVLVGDAEIDTKLIQPENSKLQDLDDDVRGTVEKMMFDQRQKAMGKPTSKELEQAAILEKFKAQHPEMDFSNVKFGN